MTRSRFFGAAGLTLLAVPALAQLAPTPPVRPEPPPRITLIQPGPAVPDWLGYNYDPQRTGWNRGETQLSPKTVARLRPLWNTQLTTKAQALVLSTLTAPVVAGGVATPDGAKDLVFSVGMDDVLSAVDAASGKIVWQKSFPNSIKPLRPAVISCSNTEQATPVIDKVKGVIYFTTSDGRSVTATERCCSSSRSAERYTSRGSLPPSVRRTANAAPMIASKIFFASSSPPNGQCMVPPWSATQPIFRSSVRYWIASATCAGSSASEPARSAMVRARRRMRS